MITDAYLSPDRLYRYWLFRQWDDTLPVNCTCGINPSTADERDNDPTIRKDIGFSARQGFGGLLKLNVAAYRSNKAVIRAGQQDFLNGLAGIGIAYSGTEISDPNGLLNVGDPMGPENSPEHLRVYYESFGCQQFIACWGRNGGILPVECKAVLAEFTEAVCFGFNSDGTPRHTVRLSYDTPLELVLR